MFGYVKGYDIRNISKRKAEKEGFGVGLNSVVATEALQKGVLEVINNGGKVYGLYKKKEMVACYILTKEKVNNTEINQPVISLNEENISKIIQGKIDEVSTDNSNEVLKNEEVIIFRLSEKYISPQHANVMQEFEKVLISELKEYIVLSEVKAVIWEENMLVATQVKAGALGSVGGLAVGMLFGMIIGISLDNIGLGIALGMLWE